MVGPERKREPIIDYDHHSKVYRDSAAEIHQRLRAECPVAWTDSWDGFWVVTRHGDVVAAARDADTFSSHRDPNASGPGYTGITIPPTHGYQNLPAHLDGRIQQEYRKITMRHFTPGATQRWIPFLESLTTACIDRVIEQGEADLVYDLVNPIPAIWTSASLGLPVEEWKRLSTPFHDIAAYPVGTTEQTEAQKGLVWIRQVVDETVMARRQEPRDDVISAIVQGRIDDEPLTQEEAVNYAVTILTGGVDTVTSLLANTFAWLANHPAERDRLREDPSLLPRACEEFLRYFAPSQALARTATTDVELGGTCVFEGDRVLLQWASANRDEAVFDQPEDIILDRWPNPHTSFAIGPHRCLGSTPARKQFEIVVGNVLRRIPDYQVKSVHRYETVGMVNGIVSLPITFTPGAKEGDVTLDELLRKPIELEVA